MMKSRIICILLLLVGVSGISAQSLTVTGKVVDNEGLEVIGGNVTVKGKQNTGTITDINGRYTITVSDPQYVVLVFSEGSCSCSWQVRFFSEFPSSFS